MPSFNQGMMDTPFLFFVDCSVSGVLGQRKLGLEVECLVVDLAQGLLGAVLIEPLETLLLVERAAPLVLLNALDFGV